MLNTQQELNDLTLNRHRLLRSFDSKEITKEEFEMKMKELMDKLRAKTNLRLEELHTVAANKYKLVEDKMKNKSEQPQTEGTPAVKEPKEKGPRKEVANSNTSFIAKALEMKSVKSFEAVADKVSEWKPGVDRAKIINQTKIVISHVKKQDQLRWQAYTWNEPEFLLIKKVC
jgi:hypothetical protein